MNKRLIDEYQKILKNNTSKFLSSELVLTSDWGTNIWGITLQIDLSETVKDKLSEYQQKLDSLEPSNLYLLPRQYQHISFNQIVFWGGEYKNGRQETWNEIKEEFISKFRELDNQFQSFNITFQKIINTTTGVIWTAADENDEMESLRNIFLEKLPFPKETTKLNHIIHTTIARYKNKLNNPMQLIDFSEANTDQITMQVSKIYLKNELVFPSVKTQELSSIELK